jgi:hypothetical protein
MAAPLPSAQEASRPIASTLEAKDVIGHLSEVMDALLSVVDQETALVRAGHLREAAKLEATKSNLARLYATDTQRVKISVPFLAKNLPGVLTALRERHQNFSTLLQTNLTVLATAHAVSEGIMRQLSQDIARKSSPQTYGATGRASAPKPHMGQPLTVCRVS